LENRDADRRIAIERAAAAVIGGAQLHAGDVAQISHSSDVASLDDDRFELLLVHEPAQGAHRILELARIRRQRGPADNSGGDLHILLLHRFDDVAGGDLARGQLVREEPKPHGIIARAENQDVAHARQTRQLIANLQRHVVAHVQRVQRLLRRINLNHQRDVRRRFLRDDSLPLHLRRQDRLGDRDAVLHCTCAMSRFVPTANVTVSFMLPSLLLWLDM